jgi:hypothetical protein
MQRNPYTPPSTPVADITSASVTPNREVLLACQLIWASFSLSLIGSASELVNASTIGLMIGLSFGLLIGGAIGFAITKWIVSKLQAGRNWMRLLFTILSVLGYFCIPIFWKFYSPLYAAHPIKGGVTVLGTILNIWAIVLLNIPRSRAWFTATKIPEQGHLQRTSSRAD